MLKYWINIPNIVKEGLHLWSEAKDDIQFLSNEHFHYFHISVKIEVFHNDREIEFIQFRRWLEKNIVDINYMSCEMIGGYVISTIVEHFPNRDIVVTVSEDGINGAVIEYTK